jgi:hypothetical protein
MDSNEDGVIDLHHAVLASDRLSGDKQLAYALRSLRFGGDGNHQITLRDSF